MTCFLRNGADNLGKRRAAWNRVETTLGLTDTWKLPRQYGLRTAVEEYDEGLEESKAMLQDQIDHGHDFFNKQTHAYRFGNSVPFGQTTMLFIPCLKSLASEEQQAKWIPKALRGEILGNYVSYPTMQSEQAGTMLTCSAAIHRRKPNSRMVPSFEEYRQLQPLTK